jgi:hypothetical protein
MSVLDKNHKSSEMPVDNFSPGYRPVGKQTAAQIELLYCDIQRFLRLTPDLTPARIAAMAGLGSAWIVRDIRKPNWHAKNAAQLFKIEYALSRLPSWFPKTILGEEDCDAEGAYVYRRWVRPEESPEFREDFLHWTVRQSDRTFIDRMKCDPWVTILDVRNKEPTNYRIMTYASGISGQYAFNKAGKSLGEHPSPPYAEMTARDFGLVVETNQARCKDMVHFHTPRKDRVVFLNIAFPCLNEGKVVSKMKLEYWTRSPLGFNAPRSEISPHHE